MIKVLTFLAIFACVFSLPYEDQMTLANSLIVGRDDMSDLYNWECNVCDASNKPIHAHFIQEKAKDIKCILSVYPKFLVLAFRYTNTALNVWQDILYPLQIKDEHTCSNCKVQKAYNNMWETIKNQVFADLKLMKAQTKLDTLYITGISLGGGLAVISYVDVNHENLFSTVKVTTYGAPRVGNKYWAAHFDLVTQGRTRRYLVKGDPIVILPRCLTLLCTYRQTGIQIVCTENDQLCVQEQYIPDDDDQFGVAEFRRNNRFRIETVSSIMDHVNGYPKIYNHTLVLKE